MVTRHFIDGVFVSSETGEQFDNLNPATGERIGSVTLGGASEIDRAVLAARRAFATWGRMPVAERSRLLHRLADLIEAHQDELAQLEATDTGKPIALARRLDIARASANFRFFADAVKMLSTETFDMDGQALNYALRRPVGVAGLISPWNLPLLLLTWKVAPALAAGNTVVAKPAELTPLTATRLAELIQEAGIPDGVYNVVHGFGPGSAGEALTRHPGVDLISLTGETVTGKAIMAQAAPSLKRLSFELGGKNSLIILEDADFERLIETTLQSSFSNQGEVCLSPARILVQEELYDRFVDEFSRRAAAMRVGDPLDGATEVGALISEEHRNKVEAYLEVARQDGGQIVVGGRRPSGLPARVAGGYFLEPTVITGLSDASRVVQEEIFGPVVTIQPFKTPEEAVARANATRYGLSATIWTQNLTKAHRIAAELEAGIIWINTWFLRDLRTPFGGMKESGIGREGGVHSFEFYTELKNVCIKL
ncbi:MAG: aldehyde dehydrogenase [Sulfobacillus sp.]|nr:aldehyde dehydrogenase [Sulfobacillus sp.]